jgi:hypothetical protein
MGRIIIRKRVEIIGGWRKLHNEELHDLYLSPNVITLIRIVKSRRMKWERNVARMGEKRSIYRVLKGLAERERPLQRPSRR